MEFAERLRRWLEVLAGLFIDWYALSQARKSIIATREDGCFVVRRPGAVTDDVLAKVAIGTRVPGETAQALRKQFITFELTADKVVRRHLTVPVKAQDFVAGIVRNQIERLSPWVPAQAIYSFTTNPSQEDGGGVNVDVLIASRASIDSLREELVASGLSPDKISVRMNAGEGAAVALWTRPSQGARRGVQNVPRLIGASLAVLLLVSTVVSFWAVYSANAIGAEQEEVAARTITLQRRSRSSFKPEDLAALSPADRAWVLKENSPVAVLILDALARVLPDGAYLSELHLENRTLRIIGLAADAPSLIAALEKHGRFSEVHFFAPTTKGADDGLYRFYIEARVDSSENER